MDRWRGRVAIVTGASAGIGKAIAISLAENGLKVVGTARRLDILQEMQKSIKGEFYPLKCDVTKEEDIINAVKWTRENLGGADVLVNNAGINPNCPLTDFDSNKFENTFKTNVFGLCFFTREVVRDMKDRKVDDGHIFHINSVAGHSILHFNGVYHPYGASKHAVTVLTEGLRRELRDMGSKIRVTSISPGLVKTEIFNQAGGYSNDDAKEMFDEFVTLDPKDIADALVYALGTGPNVQVHDIIIKPLGEKF